MGCDIHCFAEKFEGGAWHQLTGFTNDFYKEGHEYFGDERFKYSPEPITGRNYWLFALLANVRNGWGVAGSDRGDAIEPIAMPKGFPKDACDAVALKREEWGCDGHSDSYLTIAEIEAYEWDKHINQRGVVSFEEFKRWLDTGEDPKNWYGSISGPGIVTLDGIGRNVWELEGEIRNLREGARPYVKIQWKRDMRPVAAALLEIALPQLKAHSSDDKGEDVRIVFWFDN